MAESAKAAAQKMEEEGLIAPSYDAMFNIDTRVRKINDLHLPTRSGLTVTQIFAFIVVLMVSVIFYGLVLLPIGSLIFGRPTTPWPLIICTLGPAVLASWGVVQPMRFSKTIPGTIRSTLRFYLDDPTHRRGQPVPTPRVNPETANVHYLRTWVMDEESATLVSGEGDFSDPETERAIKQETTGELIHLEHWYEAKRAQHREQEMEAERARKAKGDINYDYRRGVAASVVEEDE